jgi:hypothetical protein
MRKNPHILIKRNFVLRFIIVPTGVLIPQRAGNRIGPAAK